MNFLRTWICIITFKQPLFRIMEKQTFTNYIIATKRDGPLHGIKVVEKKEDTMSDKLDDGFRGEFNKMKFLNMMLLRMIFIDCI